VEAGANVEANNKHGDTPLHDAGACDGCCVFVLFCWVWLRVLSPMFSFVSGHIIVLK